MDTTEAHPVIYPTPSASQLALVGGTFDLDTLKREFPKLFEILVLSGDQDDGVFSLVSIDEGGFFVECFECEAYVEAIPGHMMVFHEQLGANVTLVFTATGLIG